MNTAAERLLGLTSEHIQELAKDILFGQLRLVIATMTIEEINSDRDKFLENISKNVDSELKKIGLKLINVNVTDIKDESGYIAALGKEAAAKAINEAKISVAEQEKIGETGKALADREKDTQIAETHRDRDVKIAITQKDKEISIATAIKDETIGKAGADRDTRVKTSEANAIAIQAAAETIRENAKGEADAIFAKMEAEAKGLFEILTKQAEGYKQVVAAAGGDPSKAFQLLLIEKLPELVRTQVEAVKNIKIDKITVWDSGNGQTENGNSTTANFVSGMMKTVPPLNDLFNMAGLNLPNYLKGVDNTEEPPNKKVEDKKEL